MCTRNALDGRALLQAHSATVFYGVTVGIMLSIDLQPPYGILLDNAKPDTAIAEICERAHINPVATRAIPVLVILQTNTRKKCIQYRRE